MPGGRPDNPVSGAPGIRAVYVVGCVAGRVVARAAFARRRVPAFASARPSLRDGFRVLVRASARPGFRAPNSSQPEPIKTYANRPYISISALAKSLFTYSVHFVFALVASLAYA